MTSTGTTWFIIALAAQGLVAICFLGQLAAYLRGGKIVIPQTAIGVGVVATLVALVYAAVTEQWVLLLAEATNLAAGLQLAFWYRKTEGVTAGHRRRRLPVVSPEHAEPKSGVFPATPKPGAQQSERV